MNKFFVSCILAALLFAVPIAAFVLPDNVSMESERRKSVSFPDMPPKFRSKDVKRFFQGVDAFFADHFPLRSPMLGLVMVINEATGDSLDMDKCYRGKDNWLFLGNNYARCVDTLQGRISLPSKKLKWQTAKYVKMRDEAKKYGSEFIVFIGPNKSSIYPEYLPPVVVPGKLRYISPLTESLRAAGMEVYDPTDRLMEAKSVNLLYYRTDTHWNTLGAYEAFEGFRKRAGLPVLPPLSFDKAPEFRGDLVNIGGYNHFDLSGGDNFTLHWSIPPSLLESDGLITNAHAPSEKTTWVFGDSFAVALRPYITAMFKEVRFFRHDEFEAVMASQPSRPDMIIWVVVERNFAPS